MGKKAFVVSYLIREPNGQYHAPQKAYPEIEILLKNRRPFFKGARLMGRKNDYILENAKFCKGRTVYFFLEIPKKKKEV